MKRRAISTDATVLINNTSTGARQTLKIQVLGPGTVFVSTQQNDLQQLDNTGSPINGLRLTQISSVEDGTFRDFLGELWIRADQGVDIDVTIYNSPPFMNKPMTISEPKIPPNAPFWEGWF